MIVLHILLLILEIIGIILLCVLALIIFIATAVMVYKHKDNYKRLREGTEIGFLRANKGEDRVKPSKND